MRVIPKITWSKERGQKIAPIKTRLSSWAIFLIWGTRKMTRDAKEVTDMKRYTCIPIKHQQVHRALWVPIFAPCWMFFRGHNQSPRSHQCLFCSESPPARAGTAPVTWTDQNWPQMFKRKVRVSCEKNLVGCGQICFWNLCSWLYLGHEIKNLGWRVRVPFMASL